MTATELEGWTVVVTRAEPPGGALGARFGRYGARVLHLPTVEIGLPRERGPLEAACARVGDYSWVAFTSARAVEAVHRLLDGSALPRIAVVGEATGEVVRECGWSVALEGSGEGGAALARALLQEGASADTPVLFPASSRARPELVRVLSEAGVPVDQVTAYETRILTPELDPEGPLGEARAVVFTSPSAVEGWGRAAGEPFRGPLRPDAHLVAIGGTTGGRLERFGVRPVIAAEPSFDGVVDRVRELRRRESR